MNSSPDRTGVLFICLGNICRSPLAEGIFLHKINERGVAGRFRVDSAGTGAWHVGEPADPRAQNVAKKHGIALPSRGRVVNADDFSSFHHLICMDQSVLEDILALGAPPERTRLLLELHPASQRTDVPDPYWGGPDGFETVFDLISAACDGLLDELLAPNR